MARNAQIGGDPTTQDHRWEKFVESLESKGYFNGNIPGSQEYRKLRDAAKSFSAHCPIWVRLS
eukprot:m.761400 g.761400  ORF g.761400 m.761400 type:complete len:63 (-) comp59044_c0_seq63:513-701(-)